MGKIKSDLLRTKSNSLLELPIVSHHLTAKKSKYFKHINKFPRMQGSPEMRRAFTHIPKTAALRSYKLSTDSNHSGDEPNQADKFRTSTQSLNVVTKSWRNSDSRCEYSSSSNSLDDFNPLKNQRMSDPLSEEFAKQIAEDFQKKTLLLTLEWKQANQFSVLYCLLLWLCLIFLLFPNMLYCFTRDQSSSPPCAVSRGGSRGD